MMLSSVHLVLYTLLGGLSTGRWSIEEIVIFPRTLRPIFNVCITMLEMIS